MDPDIRRALRRALGILAAALTLCGLGVWGTVTATTGFAYSAGFTGTPGHLVAASCELDPAEANTVSYCRGVFHPDADAPAVPEARINSRVALGQEVAVRCDGRTCHSVETSVGVAWAAGAFAALAVVAAGCGILLGLARAVIRTRRPEQVAVGAAVTLAACALLCLVAAFVTSLTG
ncbi:hypothetical protein [Kitasatospora sp. NPDC002040]|uniref:hypothetical protein n=1 Tax=Kitasatospora sp. NPDC002040 TaxID=3154661 RepID=UPI003331F4FB